MMIRKKAFDAIGGYTSLFGVGMEDYALMMRCQTLKFVVLPEPYLHFREHKEKIRIGHVDWRSTTRLQAGQWRVISELETDIPLVALAYARQLHDMTTYQYVPQQRPRFFNIKSVILHQYIRSRLARSPVLRKILNRWAAKQGPIYRFIARIIFPGRL